MGWSARRIGRELAGLGLVERPEHFELAARWQGVDADLRAGRFVLSRDWNPLELARQLQESRRREMERLTVPEGSGTREIMHQLYAACGIAPASLERLLTSPELLARHHVAAGSLEGYLFPDTYDVAGLGVSDATRIVLRMLERFESAAREIGLATDANPPAGLSRHEMVTLASLIEREARDPSEFPLVAAVFYNRLSRGMRLESCATVLYALGRRGGPLLFSDLGVDSPYNTYRRAGLPPGPICNPGRRALAAALSPAATDALYFIAKGDGTHYFSRTLAEHRSARRQR
ncbi:endolytic transglycosylase MltG [bacterium]|nr:endolytic transglycosylase MltG [bacterium]